VVVYRHSENVASDWERMDPDFFVGYTAIQMRHNDDAEEHAALVRDGRHIPTLTLSLRAFRRGTPAITMLFWFWMEIWGLVCAGAKKPRTSFPEKDFRDPETETGAVKAAISV